VLNLRVYGERRSATPIPWFELAECPGHRSRRVSNEEFARLLQDEEAMWASLAKIAGFKPQ
jgi:hypothetical protein